MDTKPKTQAKDFFIYLGALVTLMSSAVSLITIWFSTLERALPDALDSTYYYDIYSYAMRAAIATIIVMFPLFIVFIRAIRKNIEAHPEKAELGVRKWLSYLTIFIAGSTVAGDLIVTINAFLGGELSTRFAAKALVILVVGGGILFYYLKDIKAVVSKKFNTTFAVITGIIILITLITAFAITGSPLTIRKMKFDSQRVDNLQSIQSTATEYWRLKREFPEVYTDLAKSSYSSALPKDPETNKDYEYRKISAESYEICANFARDNTKDPMNSNTSYYYDTQGYTGNPYTPHGAGRVCFTRTIDPAYHPKSDTLRD